MLAHVPKSCHGKQNYDAMLQGLHFWTKAVGTSDSAVAGARALASFVPEPQNLSNISIGSLSRHG
jgi:hypothetical protein